MQSSTEVHSEILFSIYDMSFNKITGNIIRRAIEVIQPIIYEDKKLDYGYRIDLLFENAIVMDLKTVKNLPKSILHRFLLV